ncbi:MAG: hypothetical protein HKO57_04745 [Akkermansiaceae bacterium]|nr:hypothetical protein [Akkermansiaceae bacterium]
MEYLDEVGYFNGGHLTHRLRKISAESPLATGFPAPFRRNLETIAGGCGLRKQREETEIMSVFGSLKTILSAGPSRRIASGAGPRRTIERLTLEEAGLAGMIIRASAGAPMPAASLSRGGEQPSPGRLAAG